MLIDGLYRGIFLWDQLPSDTQVLNDKVVFKRQIRCSLMESGQIKFLRGQNNSNILPMVSL